MSLQTIEIMQWAKTASLDRVERVHIELKEIFLSRLGIERFGVISRRVLDIVQSVFGCPIASLTGKAKHAETVDARFCAYALLTEAGLTMTQAGAVMNREHCTIVEGRARWFDRVSTDKRLARKWEMVVSEWRKGEAPNATGSATKGRS